MKRVTEINMPKLNKVIPVTYFEYDNYVSIGNYTLSKFDGTITNDKTGKVLKKYINPKNSSGDGKGYQQYTLRFNGQKVTKPIHKWIALFKFGKMANGCDADHSDNEKYNNSWDNIELDSLSQRGKHKK
ncbi:MULTISPECIES: HNH endonuclease family protein [Citrobacter]|uniref:hypothetical protein n=1 Tax=Citrobacter TaxID=544 RepID=UPI0019016015|nr:MULTISPECIES: hypothetical protein [Citrobacter]MBJ9134403.1 hypothetical protein [Citrobacter farmeri]MDM2738411.1 HNH endonuclease [Citrobacter sp. Ct235]